ncbi:E3 ubiquitin/ISG15 ligase TRIM25-like [Xyrauchen texanus]|uniref:E3 ubiquitin/ISG15 ligase TRIM25-like n=1 Tax=Xyrauchen texanus TaxID=154827 RepID=UPI00224250B0|nr:E3 ubiquitin/ISG15 ligase TRIM25-like [Xyrauchen texanus]
MAGASISVDQDQFCCPVCLDLLKDPVTIPCGHSYCMSCITDCWNQDDLRGVYRCPQCRKTFTQRPDLSKNVVFAEMVTKLKKTRIQENPCYAGAADVECDVCTGRKQKAVKSCLVCLNSYCQNHLEQHKNFFKSKRHNLIDATGRLQEMICPLHDKMLEIYCRTDQRCICMLCMVDEHKNHNTISAAAARTEKQRDLLQTQSKLQQRIKDKEKDVQELREFQLCILQCSAQTAVEDCELIFTELISSIERRCSEVTQLIRDQEKAAVSRAEELLMQLEQEIDDLRRRNAEMQQLSHTNDHIHFLQSFQSLCLFGSAVRIKISSHLSYDPVGKSVSQLRDKLQHFCRGEIEKISARVRGTKIIQNSGQFSLDLNTVNPLLHFSERNNMLTFSDTKHYPDYRWVYKEREGGGGCLEFEWSGK